MSGWFRPALGVIEARGSDRVAWLSGLVTSDLATLSPTSASYGLVLSKVGRILSDACVLADDARLLVGVSAPAAQILEHFERHLVMEDVELRDASADGDVWFVLGAAAGGASIDLGLPSTSALWVPAAERARRAEELGEELSPAAWDELRLAHGVPAFGVDFDAKTYPQEARLEGRAVSFSKGCYLGQEVVCRLQMRGQVHRLLAPFEMSAPPPSPGEVARIGGAEVGVVTSAAVVDGGVRGLAMLKRAAAAPSTALELAGRSARVVG